MKIERIVVSLGALLRANSIIADIHARHLLARCGLTAVAGVIATFGVLMLGVAGYFALEIVWGPI